jgi:preprotein translocase subunit SecG
MSFPALKAQESLSAHRVLETAARRGYVRSLDFKEFGMNTALGSFILVIHCILAIALVGVVLLQRSEGGALGMGGGPSGFMSARGASNLLTRATSILATLFVLTSLGLAGIAAGVGKGSSAIEKALEEQSETPAKAMPTKPVAPKIPVAQ